MCHTIPMKNHRFRCVNPTMFVRSITCSSCSWITIEWRKMASPQWMEVFFRWQKHRIFQQVMLDSQRLNTSYIIPWLSQEYSYDFPILIQWSQYYHVLSHQTMGASVPTTRRSTVDGHKIFKPCGSVCPRPQNLDVLTLSIVGKRDFGGLMIASELKHLSSHWTLGARGL